FLPPCSAPRPLKSGLDVACSMSTCCGAGRRDIPPHVRPPMVDREPCTREASRLEVSAANADSAVGHRAFARACRDWCTACTNPLLARTACRFPARLACAMQASRDPAPYDPPSKEQPMNESLADFPAIHAPPRTVLREGPDLRTRVLVGASSPA